MMSFSLIASMFLFTSCEKEDMDDYDEDGMTVDSMQAVVLQSRGDDTVLIDYPVLLDEYVAANYPDLTLIEVTRDGMELEAELSDGTILLFDLEGNFLSEELPDEMDEEEQDSIVTEWPLAIDDYLLLNYPNDAIDQVTWEEGEYEVELSNGTEVTFDAEGNFLEVELDSTVTEWPVTIDEYIALNYPDATILEVELEDEEYEVELDTEIELVFDLDGNFLKED